MDISAAVSGCASLVIISVAAKVNTEVEAACVMMSFRSHSSLVLDAV